MLSRRWASASATALVAALALSACSGSSSSSSTTAAADPLASVTVAATAAGKAPDVSLTKTPLTVSKTVSKVVTEGGGAPLTSSDLVSINAMIVNGADGKTVTSTWDSTPVGLDLGASDLFPSLKNTLPGMKVGSRILIASPPADAFGTSGNSSLGISATDSVVFVVDVLSTTKALAAASGHRGAAPEEPPEGGDERTARRRRSPCPRASSRPRSWSSSRSSRATGAKVDERPDRAGDLHGRAVA